MTDNRIKECKDMINILKANARSVPAVKQRTVIKSVSLDSYLFVLDETLAILNSLEAQIDEQAQEIYGLREDLASLKWNLNKCDPQLIDFPNS